MRKITADMLYPIHRDPIPNGVLVLDEEGVVLAVDEREFHDPASLEVYQGALVPGFINTHCHLELCLLYTSDAADE